ncbi:hypothetical protein H5392_01830 [Tessaracoccus sp. MC1865]|uniref:hypothetical protein n=1 Tax=Tessaracoccus sp. MC1865 TaxID=2760310 RepID=UPI0015FF6732|nr:hypothetical protein [Tessaracoccus sp. MC1865]MBB1482597.1 hypothetical protein [Tessaracoccus sp. MC1865]QTO37950.1 hypothetical protein J7D54_02260 [Tessaracoccus sp. MC1865]
MDGANLSSELRRRAGGDEARQAEELEAHLRLLWQHPSVVSATYWRISDVDAWLGAPAGLVRLDGTPKPAYHALRRLVKEEWWTPPATLRTDAEGRVAVEGWKGRYRAVADGVAVDFDLADAQPEDLTLR